MNTVIKGIIEIMGVNLCLRSLVSYDKTVMCKSAVIKIFSRLSKICGRRRDSAD